MSSLSFSIQLIPWKTLKLYLKNHDAAGLDELTAEILKVSLDVICNRLTYLVNESLRSCVFLKVLEAGRINNSEN